MKKILVLSILLFITVMPVSAATIKVKALSDFNTENPTDTLTVEAVTDLNLDNEIMIFQGYTMKGDIVDVVSPKRLKRDATFSFILTEYIDREGVVHKVDNENRIVKGKFTTKFNYLSVAKSAALTVGSYFVKGLSLGYAAVEGAIKNEEDNRLKSSAVSLYESTPISYVEKGQDIVIAKDQVFMLNFKLKDEETEEPNYEYTDLSGENDTKEKITDDSQKLNEKEVNSTLNKENVQNVEINDFEDLEKNEVPASTVKGDSDAVEYENHDGFHLRRRTRKYPIEMKDQTVPDTAEPMSVPDPVNKQPLAPLELPETY